jgi:hypothetical protein
MSWILRSQILTTAGLFLLISLEGCWVMEDLAPLEAPTYDAAYPDDSSTVDTASDSESPDAGCSVDELFFRDDDGDGFGVSGTTRCGSLTPFTASAAGDCDDTNGALHPEAPELCNGIDDNCDGVIDEGVRNDCGSCGELPVDIGSACGGDGCQWACMPSVPGPVCSLTGGDFVCGTCSTWFQGQPCGACGRTACAEGFEEPFIVCVDAGPNACGGCESLPVQPGRPCGGGEAAYQCTGPDSVECSG